ncbi:hypothetical protein UFOVP1634_32 [uncultured Caudovirales phage]|uniref:Uncharacterized protein n=1 Tax=uncultured Caudovirales phage TaxID=2100421 RepID=A0A6J5SZM8_9CAUD|nr:hypothetical protein UFOVP1030_9 [uncultured Caudovirales phage]CAB4220446.1 hypothetical protein UFOVP1634_32 [uncultured Caudovirales phage]
MMNDLAEISYIENESLPAHVAICAQRYKQVDLRLLALEIKMNDIQHDMLTGQKSMKITIISSSATIVASLLGLVLTLLMKF